LADLRRNEPKSDDDRIFPMVYAGVIIKQGGRSTSHAKLCKSAHFERTLSSVAGWGGKTKIAS